MKMGNSKNRYALTLSMLILLATPLLFSQAPGPPGIRIAILGDPAHQVAWTDEAMEKLKAIGFNTVQLNIAWGSRPFGEALDLVDVVTVPGEQELPGTAERRAEISAGRCSRTPWLATPLPFWVAVYGPQSLHR